MSKNNDAWEVIFRTLDILKEVSKNGSYTITAEAMRLISNREPRLLAKIDKRSAVPQIMRENGLSILAVENGKYKITKEDPFIEVPSLNEKLVYPIKRMAGLMTLDDYDLKSKTEAMLLDLAHYNSILDDCFEEKVFLTLRSRSRGSFDFKLGRTDFNVDGVQVEIDGCYEGAKGIHIVEVKPICCSNYTTIRQLLYAKRMVEDKVAGKKAVNAWMLMFDRKTSVFNFYKFVDNNKDYHFNYAESKRYILK